MSSRYGGAATTGRAWTDDEVSKYDDYGYGPEKRRTVSPGTAATVGGGGVAVLGAKQMLDASRVGDVAGTRHGQARAREREASYEHERQQQKLSDFERKQASRTRLGRKIRGGGKRRRLTYSAEEAERRLVNAANLSTQHEELNTPAKLVARGRHMRKVGGVMVLGGGLVAGRSLLPKIGSKPKEGPASKSLSEVSKTITQSRYGSAAEMGRAWRDKEEPRRNPKAGSAAIALGGTSAAGGAVGLAGLRRLSRPKSVDPTKRHALETMLAENTITAHEKKVREAGTAHQAAREAAERRDLPELRRLIRERGSGHRVRESKQPGNKKLPGGRFVGMLEGEHKEAQAKHGILEGGRTGLRERQGKEVAVHLRDVPARALARRSAKIGLPIAGVAGVGALVAGRKAEQGRSPFGKPTRRRPEVRTVEPREPAPEPKKDWQEHFTANERKGFERTLSKSTSAERAARKKRLEAYIARTPPSPGAEREKRVMEEAKRDPDWQRFNSERARARSSQ